MNSKKMFFVMIGALVLLSGGIIATLVFGNSFLKEQSSELAELKLEEQVLDQQETVLTQASQDIEQYSDLEDVAANIVPQDKDQARAVREIIKLAESSGIAISSITFPSSNLGTKQQQPARQPSDDDDEETPAESSTPPPPPISQATPVQGISGVYALEMNIVPDANVPVTYYQFLEFLEKLENNRRTAQVTRVQITPTTFNSNNPLISFTLTINIFVKP